MDTGRTMQGTGPLGVEIEIAVDSDVLVTEQRLVDSFGFTAEQARQVAASVVDTALNAVCPCCDAEDGISEGVTA